MKSRLSIKAFFIGVTAFIVLFFTAMSSAGGGSGAITIPKNIQDKLKPYETKYYILYSDLPEEAVNESILRLTTAADEFAARTKGFAGAIRAKAPVYIFSDSDDYKTIVGAKYAQSAGLCQSVGPTVSLFVRADAKLGSFVWTTMRHEGFHQFVRLVIGGQIPIWVNEGLAVYFECSIWTGDNLVCDVIPPDKLKDVKAMIVSKKYTPFSQMVEMTHEKWNSSLKHENYIQAWSMVYFLAHAENGKYQKAFSAFINDVAGGAQPRGAFANRIGSDFDTFQKKYCEYWTSMPDNPSLDLYRQATVQILTGFLARACMQKKQFKTADEFFEAAEAGKLNLDPKNKALWLPDDLLTQTLKAVKEAGKAGGEWSLEGPPTAPKLVMKAPDGAVITGDFKPGAGGVPKISSAVQKPDASTDKPDNSGQASGEKGGASTSRTSLKSPGRPPQ